MPIKEAEPHRCDYEAGFASDIVPKKAKLNQTNNKDVPKLRKEDKVFCVDGKIAYINAKWANKSHIKHMDRALSRTCDSASPLTADIHNEQDDEQAQVELVNKSVWPHMWATFTQEPDELEIRPD